MSDDVTRPKRKPYPLKVNLGFLVHDVARIRRNLFDSLLKPLGLTRSQRWMLIYLSQFEDGVTQTELAESMNVGQVSLGEKLLLLENLGYVSRQRGAVDRRQKIVTLTDRGYEVMLQSSSMARLANQRILAGLSEAEIATAEHVMRAMHENLTNLALEMED